MSKLALLLGALVILGGVVLATAGLGSASPFNQQQAIEDPGVTQYTAPPTSQNFVIGENPHGTPMSVVLVSAQGKTLVNTSLIQAVIQKGVLNPPEGRAGWYGIKGWPLPGFVGPAMIAGHVSIRGKADTFYHLDQAKAGDKVIVTYSSGDQVPFVVKKGKAVSKKDIGSDSSIWSAPKGVRALTLITCDQATETRSGDFPNNYVVWAEQIRKA